MKMNNTSRYFKSSNKRNEGEPPRKKLRKSIPVHIEHLPDCIPTSKIRLDEQFFNQDSQKLALDLLGKVLVRCFDNNLMVCGRIVETEAYLGSIDKAAHSFSNKRTERTEPMFMKPGTVYVFSIYGMYSCFNISSKGEGHAVLLRAVEPLSGLELMQQMRQQRHAKERTLQLHQLCNGPSKLCLSYGITKELNKVDMTDPTSQIWIEDWKPQLPFDVVTSTRIGLSKKAAEWIEAPLRYYIKSSKSVSVIDRPKEALT